MPDVTLTEREQEALRRLIETEPVPGHPLPAASTLELISWLVPCDEIAVGLADATGCILDWVDLPHVRLGEFDPQVCDGPLVLGIVHQRIDPEHRDVLVRLGIADGVVMGFRSGRDHVVQLSLDRMARTFTARDLAVLWLIAPVVERLLRSSPTARLPATLTVQERRVLQLVAQGMANADIAARLYVAPSTVRKHLEHAFRKLGVSNRLAAVRAFEGHRPLAPAAAHDEIFA
jgi:DNA-binding CsgD family transcriptional regulator